MARIKFKAVSKKAYRKKKSTKGVNRILPHDKQKVEKKYFDTALNGSYSYITPSVQCINGMQQGTQESQRVGNRINITSIEYSFHVVSPSTPVDTPIRTMVVYDNDTNGISPLIFGAPSSQSLLDNTHGAGTWSPKNLNNKDRYVIISDKIMNFQHLTTAGLTGALNPLNINLKKWKAIKTYTQYNGSGTGPGFINKGGLYIITISDEDISLGFAPLMSGRSRIRYTDE